MAHIVVTLEDGYNASIIRNAIKMIKGVKHAIVEKSEPLTQKNVVSQRLNAFDKLAGAISLYNIDLSDERTQYLLRK